MDHTQADNRSEIELNLEHDELHRLMLMAHAQDITLNQLVEQVLQQFVNEHSEEKASHEDLDQ